jgi:hypothetical protein
MSILFFKFCLFPSSSSFLLNLFIMSSFEDELRCQGLLEGLEALPALAVSGRVPSTTGGCQMILAFLLVLEGSALGMDLDAERRRGQFGKVEISEEDGTCNPS